MVELIQAKIKKWGNSFATIIPNEVARDLSLYENQEINLMVIPKKNPFKELWDLGKKYNIGNIDSQKIKDDIRKEEQEIEKRKIKQS